MKHTGLVLTLLIALLVLALAGSGLGETVKQVLQPPTPTPTPTPTMLEGVTEEFQAQLESWAWGRAKEKALEQQASDQFWASIVGLCFIPCLCGLIPLGLLILIFWKRVMAWAMTDVAPQPPDNRVE